MATLRRLIPETSNQLTLFAGDFPAPTFPWLDVVLGLLENSQDSGLSLRELPGYYGLVGLLSKTSQGFFHRKKVRTFNTSSKRLPNSGMVWRGAYWIAVTSECPSNADVCTLSDVLETSEVPQRFYLSAKAARGILRRAERRGRTLPTQLRRALEALSSAAAGTAKTPS